MVSLDANVSQPTVISWVEERFGVDLPSFRAGLYGSSILMCSDGSFKDGHGTASWIALNGDLEMGGDLVVPDGVHSPYRSELAGILGCLRFLDSIPVASEWFVMDCRRFRLPSGAFQFRHLLHTMTCSGRYGPFVVPWSRRGFG